MMKLWYGAETTEEIAKVCQEYKGYGYKIVDNGFWVITMINEKTNKFLTIELAE